MKKICLFLLPLVLCVSCALEPPKTTKWRIVNSTSDPLTVMINSVKVVVGSGDAQLAELGDVIDTIDLDKEKYAYTEGWYYKGRNAYRELTVTANPVYRYTILYRSSEPLHYLDGKTVEKGALKKYLITCGTDESGRPRLRKVELPPYYAEAEIIRCTSERELQYDKRNAIQLFQENGLASYSLKKTATCKNVLNAANCTYFVSIIIEP